MSNQSEQEKFADFKVPTFLLERYRVVIAEYGDELINMESELIIKALESIMDVTGLESTDEVLNLLKILAMKNT